MDDIARLIAVFEDSGADTAWKLDALLDLGQHRHPVIIPFLLRVLADPSEAAAVRIAVTRSLRDRQLTFRERCDTARVLADIVTSPSCAYSDVRAHAAVAMGDFVDVDGVLEALGHCAVDPQDDFDVRYAAFTALERAGPTPDSIPILKLLRADETLGRSAQSLLVRWRL